MRNLIFSLVFSWLFFIPDLKSQPAFAVSSNTSYNRIGFGFDLNGIIIKENNHFSLGVLFYGRDYLFEKNGLGGIFKYAYQIDINKLFIKPQIKLAIVPEKKIYTQLISNDLQFQTSFGRNLFSNFSLLGTIGTGIVFNFYKSEDGKFSDTHYMNYEISLGVQYNF